MTIIHVGPRAVALNTKRATTTAIEKSPATNAHIHHIVNPHKESSLEDCVSSSINSINSESIHQKPKMPGLVSYDTETISALGAYGIKATIKERSFENGLIETASFTGGLANVSKVRTQGLATWQSQQPKDEISISINIDGSYSGHIGSRPYSTTPGKLSFVSMPGEVQKSSIHSDKTNGWMISLSCKKLLNEITRLTDEDIYPTRLVEALEGSETFLEGAAEHLLWLKRSSRQSWHEISADATRTAMISFVSSRIAEMHGAQENQATSRSLASYVDSAVSFMESSYPRPLSLGDLCEACHVSARTLQVAFRQLREETPMQTLRGIRLEMMRGLLLQGEDVSVASVKVGLSPTGRTAALYAGLYGEKPSQTAARIRI